MYRTNRWDGVDWSRSNLFIAASLGVHVGTVSAARKRLKIPRRKTGPEPAIYERELPFIASLLRDGIKKVEVARRYGVSPMTLRRRIRGVPGCSERELCEWRESLRDTETREREIAAERERKAIKESLRRRPERPESPSAPLPAREKAAVRMREFLASI